SGDRDQYRSRPRPARSGDLPGPYVAAVRGHPGRPRLGGLTRLSGIRRDLDRMTRIWTPLLAMRISKSLLAAVLVSAGTLLVAACSPGPETPDGSETPGA